MASFSAGANGALIATSLPPQKTAVAQKVQGGIIEAATSKSTASRAAQIDEYKSLGAGQKGGGANIPASILPTANSMPGVSHENTLKSVIDNHNQLKAGAVYDKLGSAQPKLVGGRVKRRRSTKKHGRRSKRTHRRRGRRSSRLSRRGRRVIR